MQKITTFLTFNDQAEAAVTFYVSLFKNSKIVSMVHNEGQGPAAKGSVLNAAFQLDGQEFMAMDAGPAFFFGPGTSLFVNCETQAEIDGLWEKLSADGGEVQGCGWVKDKFGISWQIVPAVLGQLMQGPDPAKSNNVMQALLQMDKLDIATLQRAYDQA
jgi:predicted 3-demethylubiquinone-9 3-methyltransferase (glyoxalase superfamily)